MLRVLFIILAVVSLSLAIVLGEAMLYALAAVLLIAAVGLMTAKMRRRHNDVPETFMQAPEQPEEDLAQLGIMEIKPVGDAGADYDDDDDDASDHPDKVVLESFFSDAPENKKRESTAGKARKKAPRPRIMVSEASTQSYADVLIPALRSLRASVDAYTVCLLRQEDVPLRYHIEVIVSQNSYARNGGSYSAKEPMLAGHRALVPVVYPRVGPNGFPKAKLGYYHEKINVRQVAMVPVPSKKHDDLFVLLVDTMNDDGLEAASVRVLLEQYARLVSTVLDTEAEGGLANLDENTPAKPRREIIAEEMERARTHERSLSLVLVYLSQAEELDVDVDSVEESLCSRLKSIAVDARVERFGELTYGIFYQGSSQSVAGWAGRIQSAFPEDDDVLPGGVSVGAAVLGPRHVGPDELRSDATAALQEAFNTGECIIVE
ncbi:MAG: hypothetical protein P8H65_09485 [Rhodothermales bacterium]|nr:hypothetical protein [Rhodothermales bacterium]MDG2016143.1 hypothetical protein [Rhodothermales bacterium]HAY35945.1 hypothetical protein [Bacteroidota bacterium]